MNYINIRVSQLETDDRKYCWQETENYSLGFEDRLQRADLLYGWLIGAYEPKRINLTGDNIFPSDE